MTGNIIIHSVRCQLMQHKPYQGPSQRDCLSIGMRAKVFQSSCWGEPEVQIQSHCAWKARQLLTDQMLSRRWTMDPGDSGIVACFQQWSQDCRDACTGYLSAVSDRQKLFCPKSCDGSPEQQALINGIWTHFAIQMSPFWYVLAAAALQFQDPTSFGHKTCIGGLRISYRESSWAFCKTHTGAVDPLAECLAALNCLPGHK